MVLGKSWKTSLLNGDSIGRGNQQSDGLIPQAAELPWGMAYMGSRELEHLVHPF